MSKQTLLDGFDHRIRNFVTKTTKTAPAPKKSVNTWEPIEQCISISPSYFTIFNDLSAIRSRRKLIGAPNLQYVKRKINTGTLSRSAASRMKRAIEYLGLISKSKKVWNPAKFNHFFFKQSFITLTLPERQRHSDNQCKLLLLKPFIDALRKKYPSLSYVWKAERQKNGNIHFHIVTDHYIPIRYINNRWNRILWDNGYLKQYMRQKGHMNAPSAEIRKVRKDQDLSKYMRKYMLKGISKIDTAQVQEEIDSLKNKLAFELSPTKRDHLSKSLTKLNKTLAEAKKEPIKGKLWGCSDNLLLPPYQTWTNNLCIEDRQMLFSNECLVEKEFFQVFKFDNLKNFIHKFSTNTATELRSYFMKLFHPIPIPDIVFNTNMDYSY